MISGAFAQSFDLAWELNPDTDPPDTLQVFIIEKACKGVWENRNTEVSSETLLPGTFTELCNGVIALVMASEGYFTGQGITPNPWPTPGGGGTVTSVAAGPGISVTGTPTIAPVVNNTGVLTVAAGTNITVTGTASNPIVNNNGVRTVTAGSNVTVTGTANDPVINATAGAGSGPSNWGTGNVAVLTAVPQTIVTFNITVPTGGGFINAQANCVLSNNNTAQNSGQFVILINGVIQGSQVGFTSVPDATTAPGNVASSSCSLSARSAVTAGVKSVAVTGVITTAEGRVVSGLADLLAFFTTT